MANLEAIKELVSEEQFNQLSEALKDKDIFIGNGNFIPKSRFDEVNAKLKESETKLADATTKLGETETKLNDQAKQITDIDSLRAEHQKQVDELNNKLVEQSTTFKVKELLSEQNAKHIDLLMTKINIGEMKDDATISAKVDELKKEYADLFAKPISQVGNPPSNTKAVDNDLRKKLGLKPI